MRSASTATADRAVAPTTPVGRHADLVASAIARVAPPQAGPRARPPTPGAGPGLFGAGWSGPSRLPVAHPPVMRAVLALPRAGWRAAPRDRLRRQMASDP